LEIERDGRRGEHPHNRETLARRAQSHVESTRRYREAKRRKSLAERYAIEVIVSDLYAQPRREHYDRAHSCLESEPRGWTPNA